MIQIVVLLLVKCQTSPSVCSMHAWNLFLLDIILILKLVNNAVFVYMYLVFKM